MHCRIEAYHFQINFEKYRSSIQTILSIVKKIAGKYWLEETIIVEVDGICELLQNTNGNSFNPKVQLTDSVSNVICALMFGKRFELTDPKFSRLTNLIGQNVSIIKLDSVVTTAPFLLWFPNMIRKQIFTARRNLTAFT
ncbi:hypothetical protein BV898_17309 [Hypsibius exemplaris]|uniref:Uncharacterized protein n=1 Tax=Hypsibius exemplaris TaxID=2072580 RepID=A0A9X6RMG2_HYPEX|nr:hypothetical protein BV898_17309 [Hypsibius exemplaris]